MAPSVAWRRRREGSEQFVKAYFRVGTKNIMKIQFRDNLVRYRNNIKTIFVRYPGRLTVFVITSKPEMNWLIVLCIGGLASSSESHIVVPTANDREQHLLFNEKDPTYNYPCTE